jgi:peptidoglycan/LPS O-acetylase OafA/YrhL
VVERKRNWKKLDSAFLSLLWFWIPVHTVTFMLPKDYQIGLAALWSFMLGLLLSTFTRSNREVK